jgi:hypothetical protein
MTIQSSPEKSTQKPKTIWQKLYEYSRPDVENTLRLLVANGELADYDDELANRVKDAIDLCITVRKLIEIKKCSCDTE